MLSLAGGQVKKLFDQALSSEVRPCLPGLWPGARDPAHLVPRSLGGCDHPDCVVPLCRPYHRAYDRGELYLLPHLEPGLRAELAHGLLNVGLFRLLPRITGVRWAPVDADESRRAA